MLKEDLGASQPGNARMKRSPRKGCSWWSRG
jgi:hypothetical protein